jgi:hypothetical protein
VLKYFNWCKAEEEVVQGIGDEKNGIKPGQVAEGETKLAVAIRVSLDTIIADEQEVLFWNKRCAKT